jgi:hypothetical protein
MPAAHRDERIGFLLHSHVIHLVSVKNIGSNLIHLPCVPELIQILPSFIQIGDAYEGIIIEDRQWHPTRCHCYDRMTVFRAAQDNFTIRTRLIEKSD